MRYALLLIALAGLVWTLAGCAAPENRDQADTLREDTQAVDQRADLEPVDIEQTRQAMTRRIREQPGVDTARLAVGLATGASTDLSVDVILTMEPNHPIDDELAQAVVQEVRRNFTGMAPNQISVRDANDPGYLYVGGIGRIE